MSFATLRFISNVAILVALLLSADGLAQDPQVKVATTASAPTTQAALTMPATTAGALVAELADVPEGKADVSYENGQLVIKAHNAPLIEVVRAVCKAVGSELDAQSEPRESVLGILGPESPSKVLASLLKDFHVNYAMGGAADNPNAVASLLIFPSSKDDRQEQVARQQVGQDEQSPLSDNPSDAPVSVHEALNQAKEVLNAARAELANNAGASSGGGGVIADMEAVLQQMEAEVMAAAASGAVDSRPSQTQQSKAETTAAADPTASADAPSEQPTHHRRRHAR